MVPRQGSRDGRRQLPDADERRATRTHQAPGRALGGDIPPGTARGVREGGEAAGSEADRAGESGCYTRRRRARVEPARIVVARDWSAERFARALGAAAPSGSEERSSNRARRNARPLAIVRQS